MVRYTIYCYFCTCSLLTSPQEWVSPFAMRKSEAHVLVSLWGFKCWQLSSNLVYQVMNKAKKLSTEYHHTVFYHVDIKQPMKPILAQMNHFNPLSSVSVRLMFEHLLCRVIISYLEKNQFPWSAVICKETLLHWVNNKTIKVHKKVLWNLNEVLIQ